MEGSTDSYGNFVWRVAFIEFVVSKYGDSLKNVAQKINIVAMNLSPTLTAVFCGNSMLM